MIEKLNTHKSYGRFYRIWKGMKSRCSNKNAPSYSRYGGRGIKVSGEWLSFENFHTDMYLSYIKSCEENGESQTTIDRVDGTKGYCKENCRWATPLVQGQNKTRWINKFTYKGSTKSLAEWSRELNVNYEVLRSRLLRRNQVMDFETAISKPIRGKNVGVIQLSIPTMRVVKMWPSIVSAASKLKVQGSGIIRCAQGKTSNCGGFYWRYSKKFDIKQKVEILNQVK